MSRHRRTRLIGVYLITHEPTGKMYVGKSLDTCMRWNTHIASLRMRTHHNKELQEIYCDELTNLQDFSFKILTTCKKADLAATEKEHILFYAREFGELLMNVAGNPLKRKRKPKVKSKL